MRDFIHPLACIFVLATGTAGAATTIYRETFSGEAVALHDTTPDETTDGAKWVASTDWLENGTVTGTGADNAYLAFSPTVGQIYTLSATMGKSSVTGGGVWGAIGFAGGSGTLTAFQNNAAAPWVLYRGDSGNVDSFLGPSTGGPADEGNYATSAIFDIVLNTQAALWTAEWFINGVSVRGPVEYATNPTITHVGLGRENSANPAFDSFSLTVVPEPSIAMLLGGLGGILLLRRRK